MKRRRSAERESARARTWARRRSRTRVVVLGTIGKQTSDRVSALAAQLMGMSNERLAALDPDVLYAHIRTLAGSALSQDETPGKRGRR